MRTKLIIGSLGVFVAAAVLVGLYQFGPPGIKAGQSRVLSSLQLTNGHRLFVVARRTGHILEPFEVTLYRVAGETNAVWFYLDHEAPYW